ncbi:Cucumopine_C domain-containing protein [Chelatococcus asaccharovorans]|nr:Cucumopine_C domain-containing protein [Chelatococcus asaccharovorans]CAH1692660.1 Cucumopine_C domain-containing protein [Chelatococcus asaccharovorans]
MDMSFQSLRDVVKATKERTAAILHNEPQEIRAFRSGNLENKAGSYGQYFGTWDIAAGMIRDYSMYTYYPLVHVIENRDISLEQFCFILNSFDHSYSNYLRYSGFPDMGLLAFALREHLPSAESREEAIDAVRAFCAYTNQLAAWSFHYFPWGLGKQFVYDKPEEQVPSLMDLSRRVPIRDGRRIRLTWDPLGISVDAFLAVNENPELCRDVIAALPFRILQDHAVVTGESMYAWTPLISTAPIQVRERICDAPKGRIRFSQSTGQKFIVQYGPTTEDLAQPVLGEVIPEHADRLDEVGRRVWQSTFETKEQIWLTVSLV